ncbi:MAG TPA: decarboxylating 6-phosphogluconate dehydrogenase [Dehalococcoidia bacterium]|nr:decarboxylating 6-phosphogluconate dehydrogenase [Dehalococcoidia bacterium]
MEIGLIGLGRMGAAMAERLRRGGHKVLGFDMDPTVSEVPSLPDLVQALREPRVVWLMVPAGEPTQSVIDQLTPMMSEGDTIVDGGNSYYKDSLHRATELKAKSIAFLDAGTSGGIWGLTTGFCLMVGGDESAFHAVEPALRALAPEGGYAYAGASGAGHFAKMVHNGIEYGLLEAYAEGFHLLQASPYEFDLARIASLWNSGSVIRSWLLELAGRGLSKDPKLEKLRGYVDDSGEGRWTVLEAVSLGVPAPAIAASLFSRFGSRDENSFAMRLIAALRNEFGGHPVHE